MDSVLLFLLAAAVNLVWSIALVFQAQINARTSSELSAIAARLAAAAKALQLMDPQSVKAVKKATEPVGLPDEQSLAMIAELRARNEKMLRKARSREWREAP